MKKKVTIFTATYNQSEFIEKAIQSALAQDFPQNQYEILVINDGSTDDTEKILSKYKGKIRIIKQNNIGLPLTCNKGIKEANGKYFIRLDSDDLIDSKYLSKTVPILDSNPRFVALFSDFYLFNGQNQEGVKLSGNDIYEMIACGVMMRTDMLIKIGGYRILFWEEYDLYIRLSRIGPFFHLSEPLYYYRRHDKNMTSDIEARIKGWEELIQLYGKMKLKKIGNYEKVKELRGLLR